MTTSVKERPYWLRLFQVAIPGQGLTGLGVVCMLQANIGLEPWSVLQQGMSDTFGITFGTANIIVGVSIILLALLLGEHIGLGTLFCVFLVGVIIDFVLWLGIVPLQTTVFGGIALLRYCCGLCPTIAVNRVEKLLSSPKPT